MAVTLKTRLRQAQSELRAPIDLTSYLVSDRLPRGGERLLERRKKSSFATSRRFLDNFDVNFNKKANRSLIFDLASGASSSATKTPCF